MKLHTEKYSGDFIQLNMPELFQGCEKLEKFIRLELAPSTNQTRCTNHYTTRTYLLKAFLTYKPKPTVLPNSTRFGGKSPYEWSGSISHKHTDFKYQCIDFHLRTI
jgi:hypothetical protein